MKRLPLPPVKEVKAGKDPYPGFTGMGWDENSVAIFLEVLDDNLAPFGLEIKILANPNEPYEDIEDFWWRIVRTE